MKRKILLCLLLGLAVASLASCSKKSSSGCKSPTCPIGIRIELPFQGFLTFFH